MRKMFSYATLFNGDISKWDVSSVTRMGEMFKNAAAFNGDISKWDVSIVTNMDNMFADAKSFKQNLCGDAWLHSKASKAGMFAGSPGSIPPTTCTKQTTAFSFLYSPRNRARLVKSVNAFLQLSPEGDSSEDRHGPIGEWDVSRVIDLSFVFSNANSFNGEISKWDVSSVADMAGMFLAAKSFNGDLSKWDVSSVTDMNNMFFNAFAFNSDISKWDVSRAKNMYCMFYYAKSFNCDLSKWDVSNVNTTDAMFVTANSFNSDISKWDVSKVTTMNAMFATSTSFNSDISKWDVSKVTNMNYMFADAASFKQKLCGTAWVQSKASKNGMFEGSSGSIPRRACAVRAPTLQRIVTRRPLPNRELIVRTPITIITSVTANMMTCPRCGTFKKSGRVSCCAPGGAWFKNCGGVGNRNVDHRWFEGTEACKRKSEAYSM